MNLAAIRQEVRDRVNTGSQDQTFQDAYLNRAINAAIHFIETDHDLPWLSAKTTFVTANGTAAYPVPSDWSKTLSLRIDLYDSMQRFDYDELEDRWQSSASTGQPYEWAVWADQIELRPIPDNVYTVKHAYFKVENELAADGDSPQMPARFHAAIAEVATWLALRRDREDPRAVAAFAAWVEWKKKIGGHVNRFAGPAKVKIRVDR